MSELWERVVDPDGRIVVFDAGAHRHLATRQRDYLLDSIETILAVVAWPDARADDPFPGRERFYRRHVVDRKRWLRVVVDFNYIPACVVTVVVQENHPEGATR